MPQKGQIVRFLPAVTVMWHEGHVNWNCGEGLPTISDEESEKSIECLYAEYSVRKELSEQKIFYVYFENFWFILINIES